MALEARGLTIEAGSRIVVRCAWLRLERGELAVLAGPNGAGKTSLLAALAGVRGYRIVRGRVILDGEDVTDMPAWERARRGLVLAYQNPPTLKYVGARALAEKIVGVRLEASAEALSLAEKLRVDYLLDRRLFHGFSGGERKRFELYLTLLLKPRYMLLDEPDSGVDVDTIKTIVDVVLDRVREGVGALLVTHNVYTLRILSEKTPEAKAYVMSSGALAKAGSVGELYKLVEEEGFEGLRNVGGADGCEGEA